VYEALSYHQHTKTKGTLFALAPELALKGLVSNPSAAVFL
jgi:hypothetical protein